MIEEELRNFKINEYPNIPTGIALRQIANSINMLHVFMLFNRDDNNPRLNADLLRLANDLREKASYFARMSERWDWSPDTPRKANKVVKSLEAILKALKG